MHDAARSASLALVAEELGACDTFVFRRLAGGRFAHLGGAGRGEGWAGIVEVDPSDDTIVGQALARSGPRASRPRSALRLRPLLRLLGRRGPVSDDTVVVFGHPRHALPVRDDEVLRAGAERAAGLIEHVAVAKRLADELEVLEAFRTLSETSGRRSPRDPAACRRHRCVGPLVRARRPLPARARAGRLRQPRLADRADRAQILDAMRTLDPRAGDAPSRPGDDGCAVAATVLGRGRICSYYLLELGPTAQGMLLLMHTSAVPRGFTLLCRELGLRIVEAADAVVSGAVQRTQLELEIERLTRRRAPRPAHRSREPPRVGRRDRRGAAAQRRGRHSSVVVLDLDDLKRANDERGHACGDELLRALAEVLRQTTRARDTVARLGGDEVGVLLPGADERVCAEVVKRITTAIGKHRGVSGIRLSAAVGWATCTPGGSVVETVDAADRLMYGGKPAGRRLSA